MCEEGAETTSELQDYGDSKTGHIYVLEGVIVEPEDMDASYYGFAPVEKRPSDLLLGHSAYDLVKPHFNLEGP